MPTPKIKYTIDGKEYWSMDRRDAINGNCKTENGCFVICKKCEGAIFDIVNAEITCRNCGHGTGRFVNTLEQK